MGNKLRWIDANGNYTRVPNIVIDDVELSPSARHTYSLLVRSSFWKKLNGGTTDTLVSWIGTDALADAMDCGLRSLTRYMKELEEKGLIDRTRRMGQNSQTIIFDPKGVYGGVSRQATSGVTSGHSCPDDRPPVACGQATGGASKAENKAPNPVQGPDLGGDENPNQDVIEQDVIEQNVPEQEPRDGGAVADDAGSPGETRTAAGLNTNATTEMVETTATVEETPSSGDCAPPPPPSRPRGVLARRVSESGISKGSASKIGAPTDDLGIDDRDPETVRQVWDEFQRAVTEQHSGHTPPAGATNRELANCKTLLAEYGPSDILKLIDMVVSRWSVVREKWPKMAKTPAPSFYVMFTLRRDLMPLAQSGEGLTSRTHRVDPGAKKAPEIGWGTI